MALMRNIVVVEYDPHWPDLFLAEAPQVRNALGATRNDIYHVGSTSVPGLMAKPVIDMCVAVASLQKLDERNDAMIDIGYQPKGELGIAGRRFYSKGPDHHRTHHIHAYEVGHHEIDTHLDFRDFLRAHPEMARHYAELKSKLAARYRNDIEAYIEGKSAFITEVLSMAREWRANG